MHHAMRTRMAVGIVIAAVIALVAVTIRPPARLYELQISEDSLDMGRQYAQSTYSHAICVTNTSDKTLVIQNFATDCSCATVIPPQLVLKPNQSEQVLLQVRFPRIEAVQLQNNKSIDYSMDLVPIVDHGGRFGMDVTWVLHARLVLPFHLDTQEFNLGEHVVGALSETLKPVTVEIRNCVLDNLLASCDPAVGNVICRRLDESSYILEFLPSSTLTQELLPASCRIQGYCPESKRKVEVQLPIVGQIVEDLQLDPAVLYLSDSGGMQEVQRVSVTSRSGRPVSNVQVLPVPSQGTSPLRTQVANSNNPPTIELYLQNTEEPLLSELVVTAEILGVKHRAALVVIKQ